MVTDLDALKLLKRATSQLQRTDEESNRPSGDAVSYSICFKDV